MYLSDEQFEKLFGMARKDFYLLPKWQKDRKKKALSLF
jgi:hypothetical protein